MADDGIKNVLEITIGSAKLRGITEEKLLADEEEIKNIFLRINRLVQEEEREQKQK